MPNPLRKLPTETGRTKPSPRGLSKTERQLENTHRLMQRFNTDNAADQGWRSELSHIASELKKGPQATRPSSRVKQTPKPGNKQFIGPLSERDEEQINEGSSKFVGPYSEDGEPNWRSREEGQQFHRDFQQEQSKKGRKREYTSNRKREFRLKNAGVISDRPLKANDIYYELRKNLSPANQRLLDILTRNTEEDNVIPF